MIFSCLDRTALNFMQSVQNKQCLFNYSMYCSTSGAAIRFSESQKHITVVYRHLLHWIVPNSIRKVLKKYKQCRHLTLQMVLYVFHTVRDSSITVSVGWNCIKFYLGKLWRFLILQCISQQVAQGCPIIRIVCDSCISVRYLLDRITPTSM